MWRGIILLSCVVIANVGGSKIKIYGPKAEDSSGRLRRDARELVEMCLTNNSNPVVTSVDLLDNNWDPDGTSLFVTDHEFKKQITGFLRAYPTYVLSFESIDNLKTVIENLQKSSLWSIKSKFLILGPEARCSSLRRSLEFMWKEDLLSVYYMCNKGESTVVFTLNPFASYAPAPWVQIDQFGDTEKKMTLYRLQYSKDPEICKSLTFDKTEHLDGTNIKATTFGYIKSETANKTILIDNYLQFALNRKHMNAYKISVLINATPTLDLIPRLNPTEMSKQGYIQQLRDKTHDVHGTVMPIEYTNYKYVDVIADYSIEYTFSILIKQSDFLTEISDVTNDFWFVIGTIVIVLLFTIMMVIMKREDTRQAVMDVVRMITGMGLESPLDRLAIKLIFFTGFLFAFFIVPDFQGHMSAILSNPLRRNVESLKDLYENKFHVYYWEQLENDMINEQLWVTDEDKQYLHPMNFWQIPNCWVDAQKNSTIACVYITEFQLSTALKSEDLYVAKKVVFKKQFVLWSRKNWPLKSKFDEMALKASEPGFSTKSINENKLKGYLKKIKMKKKIEELEAYDQIGYDELMFNCYFFAFLLVFAIMVFVIEILLARYFPLYRRFQVRDRY